MTRLQRRSRTVRIRSFAVPGKDAAIASGAEGIYIGWIVSGRDFRPYTRQDRTGTARRQRSFCTTGCNPPWPCTGGLGKKGHPPIPHATVTGPLLLVYTFGSIAFLLVLILAVRLHAFLALLLTSMALGLACGLSPTALIKSIQTGTGDALGFIAIVLGLGAMIGAFLEHSGGGRVLADSLLKLFLGKENAAWAVVLAAFLVGLPIFFEVGFIILVPLVWNLAKESKRSLLFFGLAMAAPLTITHSLVPPHPAPLAAAAQLLLGTSLGSAILYGTLLSIPLSIFGGIFYAKFIANKIFVPVPEIANTLEAGGSKNPPPVSLVFFLLVLPVLLILSSTLVGPQNVPLVFLGHPFTALVALTALLCMYFFGVRQGLNRDQMAKLAMSSFAPAASLLLIMGGGGAFKQVIVDTGVGAYAGNHIGSRTHLAAPGRVPDRCSDARSARLRHRSNHYCSGHYCTAHEGFHRR